MNPPPHITPLDIARELVSYLETADVDLEGVLEQLLFAMSLFEADAVSAKQPFSRIHFAEELLDAARALDERRFRESRAVASAVRLLELTRLDEILPTHACRAPNARASAITSGHTELRVSRPPLPSPVNVRRAPAVLSRRAR